MSKRRQLHSDWRLVNSESLNKFTIPCEWIESGSRHMFCVVLSVLMCYFNDITHCIATEGTFAARFASIGIKPRQTCQLLRAESYGFCSQSIVRLFGSHKRALQIKIPNWYQMLPISIRRKIDFTLYHKEMPTYSENKTENDDWVRLWQRLWYWVR